MKVASYSPYTNNRTVSNIGFSAGKVPLINSVKKVSKAKDIFTNNSMKNNTTAATTPLDAGDALLKIVGVITILYHAKQEFDYILGSVESNSSTAISVALSTAILVGFGKLKKWF